MINGHAYHFMNYTLDFSDKDSIIPIFPSLSATSLHFPDLDFELLMQSRPSYDSDSIAYYSILSLLRDSVKALDNVKSVYRNFELAHQFKPAIKVEDALSDSLASHLTSIRHPSLISLIYIFHLLSNFWVLICLLIVGRYLWVRRLRRNVRQHSVVSSSASHSD